MTPFVMPPRPPLQRGPRALELACQDAIVAHAARFGWLVHAERTSLTKSGRHATAVQGHTGFPDLVLIHALARRFMVVELKRPPNRPDGDQMRWLAAFHACGVHTTVWWVPEQLQQIYTDLAHPYWDQTRHEGVTL